MRELLIGHVSPTLRFSDQNLQTVKAIRGLSSNKRSPILIFAESKILTNAKSMQSWYMGTKEFDAAGRFEFESNSWSAALQNHPPASLARSNALPWSPGSPAEEGLVQGD